MDLLLGLVATVLIVCAWVAPILVFGAMVHGDERVPLRWLSPVALGRRVGGPDRVVDVVVTDLVERGVLVAEQGAIAVVPNHASTRPRDRDEAAVVDAVLEVGRAGVAAVRAEVHPDIGARVLRGALLRRRFGRSAWTLPVLFLTALVPVVGADLIFLSIGEHFQTAGVFVIAGIGWLAVVPLALMSNEPGTNPAGTVRATLDQRSSQAMRVAVDGLDGLTDPNLRAALAQATRRLPAAEPPASRRHGRVKGSQSAGDSSPAPPGSTGSTIRPRRSSAGTTRARKHPTS